MSCALPVVGPLISADATVDWIGFSSLSKGYTTDRLDRRTDPGHWIELSDLSQNTNRSPICPRKTFLFLFVFFSFFRNPI